MNLRLNRKTIVILLVAILLLIYGRILVEIFTSAEPANDSIAIPEMYFEDVKLMDKDSFALLLDYPDPFTKQVKKIQVVYEPSKETFSLTSTKRQKVRITWPELQYKGRISNKENDAQMAVLKIGGEMVIMGKDSIFNGIQLKSIRANEVEIYFHNMDSILKRH